MASLMEEFISVLEQENQKYEELVGLSKLKTQTIVNADIEKLQLITEQEQMLLGHLVKMEKNRDRIRKDMSEVLNIPVDKLTLWNLAHMFEKNPQEKQKLIDLREALRLTLIEVATANQKNEVLLKQALELLDYDMTLVKSMRQAPTTANYTKNAYSADMILPIGGFDAKR